MKYTIHGFSQRKAIKLGLDNDDLLILRYFIDFKDSGAMVSKVIDNKTYYWIKYETILEQLPILKLKKDSLYRRLKKMCVAGVLEHKTVKKNGTYSFYSVGKSYIDLIADLNYNGLDNNESEINPIRYGNKSDTVRNKIRYGTDLNPDQKINLLNINLLKDSSIKNTTTTKDISSCSGKGYVEVLKKFQQCGFGLLSPVLIEKIAADVDIYSKEWVMDAVAIADEQGKHSYAYVKGILEKWKAGGKNSKRRNEEAAKEKAMEQAFKEFLEED